MSAARRHKKHHHEEHENHERWLVSGYDMMTLLFAVFVVLYAISSTNVSKVKALQQSLQDAFSGPVFSGGRAMQQTGDSSSDTERSAAEPPLPSLSPVQALQASMAAAKADNDEAQQAGQEEQDFQALKRRIDKLVKEAGLGPKVSTTVSLRGLKVKLLTDDLFFDSGSASINVRALPVLDRIGHIIAEERGHPVQVEGHTDDRPISTAQFPSNWQLSGARAGAVVQRLGAAGVAAKRMSLGGYGAQHPVASNSSLAGRGKNRRVEIVLTRLHGATTSHGGDS
jgi:chemotaxis protein MotB